MAPERSQLLAGLVLDAWRQSPSSPEMWLANTCTTPDQLVNARTLTRAATALGALGESDVTAEAGASAGNDRARLSGGQIVGHYQILQWIGAGGMGEVFRARDLALGREAALKRLPRRFTAELRTRLLHEADAFARLQHPAIATFYEAGEMGGETFIAMEYVEGDTLRSRCKQGPLALDDALSIAKCLLEGLEHAHAAGVLHCDVKPENVITPAARSAKLLDFGIARHLFARPADLERGDSDSTGLSTSGRFAGTIGYIAPEQLLGEDLDARTDVFQVGVVLYEMLTGRPAFVGGSPLERLASVLIESPDLGAVSRPENPADLSKVLSRAMARNRADRYPSAAAFLRDLEDLVEGRVVTTLPKIVAVMDFDNWTGDEDLDWIASGTAESVRAELAGVPGLVVVPRERVFRGSQALKARGGAVSASDLGLLLGSGWVVSGGVERTDGALRATMHLTEAATTRVTTTERVDGTVDGLLAIQEQLARGAMNALGVAPPTTGAKHVRSLEAEKSFARARVLLDQLSKGSVEQALELLERAVSMDPQYAPALAGLAWAYGFRSIATTDPADLDSAIRFAERAISVDPANSEAHMWRGYVLLRRGQYDEAAAACQRATELAATNVTAPYFAGSALLFGGRSADALPYLQRSLDLDDKVGMGWLALGAAHLSLQQLLEAHYSFTRARDLEGAPVRFPTAGAAAYVAEVLRLQGHLDTARGRALEGLEAAERSDHAYRDFFRAHALMVLGRTASDQDDVSAARAAFRQVLAQAQGRPRTRSCGHLVVQALARLAGADGRPELLTEALRLFDARDTYNFEPFFGALDEQTLFELAKAAHAMGPRGTARALLIRARRAGSRGALEL
jgi:TolB-like protein/Tfp pilus assembly protein PilF